MRFAMKNHTRPALASLLLFLAASASALDVRLSPASRVWLEGDSTLHAFSSTATAVDFTLSLASAPGNVAEAVAGRAKAAMTVRIPVAGLKSGSGGLDKNLQKTLKAAEHPAIVYTLKDYFVAGDPPRINVSGDLEVAGVSRPVALEAAWKVAGGKATVEGEQALLMSDFKIKPPVMMLGAVKTADKVVVKFRLELEKN